MSFLLNEDTQIGKVVIKVSNLDNMVTYYAEQIGLDILEKDVNRVVLGTKSNNKDLLELVELDAPEERTTKTGLYHFALVVPTRKDLGNLLFSAITKKVNLIGASDHLTTEAYYITDPEGNGIEIYWDKPKSEWTIHEDGQIDMVTMPMDADGVLGSRDLENPSDRMPEGTYMGHVHLQVANLKESEEFYSEILGYDLKLRFGGSALFYAAGEYHHDIGLNVWGTSGADKPKENDLGLDYFDVILPSSEEMNRLKENLNKHDYPIENEKEDEFVVVDPSGIKIHFIL